MLCGPNKEASTYLFELADNDDGKFSMRDDARVGVFAIFKDRV